MRIGILTTFLALRANADSGIGLHYRVLADALVMQGHEVHVIHPTATPDAARAALASLAPRWTCEIVPVRGITAVERVLRRSWPALVLLEQLAAARAADTALARAVQRRRLDVVETHATGTPALAYLGRRNRVPVITRVSTTALQLNAASGVHSRIQRWSAQLERRCVLGSDALLTHSHRHRDTLSATEGYPAGRFSIIPHGLPDVPLAPAFSDAAPPDAGEEILFVGRFESRKGIDTLLEAIPAVMTACPAVRLTLAGAHEDAPYWNQFLQSHPDCFSGRVQALGRVSDTELARLYHRCAVFVAPSRYESFGLVYLDAMRHAKPVVGCAVGGVPDVVRDGVTGILIPPADPTALADALIGLLRDPQRRECLGRSGRADFVERFSASRMAAVSVELYRAVAQRSPVV